MFDFRQTTLFCLWYCWNRKSWAACAQSFAPWQQAAIEIIRRNLSSRTLVIMFNRSQYRQSFHVAISLSIACSRYIYNGVILHAHPVRGESHNQRNTTGEVAIIQPLKVQMTILYVLKIQRGMAPMPFLAMPMPASKGAKMSELQAQHYMTPEQWTWLLCQPCECRTSKQTIIARNKSI